MELQKQIERNAGVASPSLVQLGQEPGIQALFWRATLQLSIPETPATGGRRPQRPRPEENREPPSQGSGALAGSTVPGRLGPAAPHGGDRPLGRRPSLPYWGGSGSLPWSLVIVPVSGPHLVPGHGCGSSELGTDGKSDGSAPGPGFSAAPADSSPTTALGSCISERERHPTLSSQAL